jgi:hypothetical protein
MRGRFVLVSLVLLGVIAALAYSNATRTPVEPMSTGEPSTALSAAPEGITPPTDSDVVADSAQAGPSTEVTSQSVDEWIADSLSENRDKRSAAIIALAQAPRAQAVPALREVLEMGDAESDRQLALRSLHTLALDQGDDDGLIRDTFREAMYHGDDDSVTQSAQAYLEDVEAAIDEGAP